MQDVIVIGGGPAGVSAALYAVRGGLGVTLLTGKASSLAKAHKIENYYGFPGGIAGEDLFRAGLEQARLLGVAVEETEVVAIGYGETGYEVKTTNETFSARAIILASGTARRAPDIDGLRTFEGRGVSYCAVCDAFFFKNQPVVVIGDGDYAVEEAEVLRKVASHVTVCTHGAPAPKTDLPCLTAKIAYVTGQNTVNEVVLDDGTHVPAKGVFVAAGIADSNALARKLGILVEDNKIVTNEAGRTNLPDVYAVGDCTAGLMQIAKAVHDGAACGLDLVKNWKK